MLKSVNAREELVVWEQIQYKDGLMTIFSYHNGSTISEKMVFLVKQDCILWQVLAIHAQHLVVEHIIGEGHYNITITHCLGLGHETMVCTVYVFLYSYGPIHGLH